MEDEKSASIEEVIENVSSLLSTSGEMEKQLSNALQQREEKGGTFITGYGFILLHCRTDAVKQLHFGGVQIKNIIYATNNKTEKEEIKLGIVMIAPENNSEDGMETISYLSKMLIERPEFIRILQESNLQEARVEVSDILETFYRFKNKKLLEE